MMPGKLERVRVVGGLLSSPQHVEMEVVEVVSNQMSARQPAHLEWLECRVLEGEA